MELNSLNAADCVQEFVGPLGRATETDGLKKVCVVGGGVGCAIAPVSYTHLDVYKRQAQSFQSAEGQTHLVVLHHILRTKALAQFLSLIHI